MIKLEDIHFSYENLPVLKGIDSEINKGEIISIIGASGAGKTTLLHILGTLEKPDSGEYTINDKSTTKLSSNELAKIRNLEIGFIFQFHNLLVEFTAFENICIPGYVSGKKSKDVEKKALELLDLLGIKDRKDHKPNELSGGEQQRVAIARALINSPSIILADEPTGNLDTATSNEIMDLLDVLNNTGRTIVMVTHEPDIAERAKTVITLRDGLIQSVQQNRT